MNNNEITSTILLERKKPTLLSQKSLYEEDIEENLSILFKEIDTNKDNILTEEEFINGLKLMLFIDITEIEAIRLFHSIDKDKSGTITLKEFVEAAKHIRWIRTIVKVYIASKNYHFVIPDHYDYKLSTAENYKGEPGVYEGDYADIRETRNYEYHNNFILERQQWQDAAIKYCLGRTESQPRPWCVFTCGPMGVGKGHVLSWLSSQGLFPLEYIVHVDPDFFKRIMPEWDNYVKSDEETAGTLCHAESAYMQEIAQEVALRQRQHVWIDGSLSDGNWYSGIFDDIRQRYPHYRIAIIYINAPEETIRARIAQRTRETGRSVPESAIRRSLESPEKSLKLLAPKTDLVVRILNDQSIVLLSVEDYSGNWHRALGKHFGTISHQPLKFPGSLGPFYLETTCFCGKTFKTIDEISMSMEGTLQLQLNSGDYENFWFELTSNHQLSAYRLTKLYQFERLYTWNLNESTTIRLVSIESANLLDNIPQQELTKKRSFVDSFIPNFSIETGEIIEIDFGCSTTSPILKKDSSCPLLSNFGTIKLIAPNKDVKQLWINKIQEHIHLLNSLPKSSLRNNLLSRGFGTKKFEIDDLPTPTLSQHISTNTSEAVYEQVMLSPLCCQSSASLVKLLWRLLHPLTFSTSSKYRVEGKPEELELSGTPRGTVYSQFVFPCEEYDLLNVDSLDVEVTEPDLLFLSFGGFIHYDGNNNILNVMALSPMDTQYFIQFSLPEPLHFDDIQQLTECKRWKKVKKSELLEEGAQYYAFIYPHEQLVTRRFPAHGSFAYIFHPPNHDQVDERDCYFTPNMTS